MCFFFCENVCSHTCQPAPHLQNEVKWFFLPWSAAPVRLIRFWDGTVCIFELMMFNWIDQWQSSTIRKWRADCAMFWRLSIDPNQRETNQFLTATLCRCDDIEWLNKTTELLIKHFNRSIRIYFFILHFHSLSRRRFDCASNSDWFHFLLLFKLSNCTTTKLIQLWGRSW